MRPLVLVLFFLSGALGLLYEVVWLRLLILVFGSTHFATTAILTAFMAGLALGSFVIGRRADRTVRHPLVLYGALEIGIGLYALMVPGIFRALGPLAASLSGLLPPSFFAASLVRFALALAALLVPTFLMGGTLPVLSRLAARRDDEIGPSVGLLYSVNTFGAVAGTALTGFVLIPAAGVAATQVAAAAANVAVGLAALAASRWRAAPAAAAGPAAEPRRAPRAAAAAADGPAPAAGGSAGSPKAAPRAALWAVAASGFIALLYEIAWTRILVLVLGSSVYAFTAMLTTFLVGIATGAWIGSGIASRAGGGRRGMEALAAALALGAAGGYATLHLLPRLPLLFAASFHRLGLAEGAAAESLAAASKLVWIEFALALAVMLPATLFSGMVFPLALRLRAGSLREVAGSVGTVYASNTAGTILGAALGGLAVLPLTGLQGGVLLASSGGILLAAAVAWAIPGWTAARRLAASALAAAAAAAGIALKPAWDPLVMNSGVFQYARELTGKLLNREVFERAAHRGTEVLFYEEGIVASVLVARETGRDNIWLAINGKIDASSGSDIATQLLLGHLPMLFLEARPPAPGAAPPGAGAGAGGARVVVIGYASGMTTGAVTRHGPAEVVAVEIEPAVLRASRLFDPYNHAPLLDPRVRVVEEDGRNYLLAGPGPHDVVISEPSNPWMTVAANLFTREFFETGRRKLRPGGIFCQWVQMYGLRTEDLRAVVRTLAAVFPHVRVFLSIPETDLVVLGSDAPLELDLDRLRAAMALPDVARDLARMGVRSVTDLLSYHALDDAGARAFAGDGPLNTDDNALIEFGAPLSLHAETRKPNQAALDVHAGDPLAGARGMPEEPALAAAEHLRLAEAFLRRGLPARAAASARRAQSIHPTEEGAAALARYEEAAAGKGRIRG